MDFEFTDKDYILVNSPKKVQWLFATLAKQKICAVDIETSHATAKPMAGQRDVLIGGVSFSWAKGTAAYLPLFTGNNSDTYWKRDDVFVAICRKLQDFLEGDCEKVMQNGKFDAAWIWKVLKIKVANFTFDTLLAHHLLDEEGRSCTHGLKPMAEFYLDPKAKQYERKLHKALNYHDPVFKRYTSVPLEILYVYACSDADYTLQLKELFEPQLEEQNLSSLFFDIVMPLQHTCMLCELGGMDIDMAKVLELETEYGERKEALLRKMAELGFGIDFNSPAQVSKLLYETLELPKQFGRKGALTTDITALEALKDAHPVVDVLREFRSVEKLSNSYVDSVKTKTNPATSRLHPSFLVHGTVTGRLSSEEPNCFHPDTEMLTRDGWVCINLLEPNKEIAQWDDGVVTFVQPTGYYKELASELVSLKSQHISLLVTKDHRCLLRGRRSKLLKVVRGEDYPQDWQQLHAGMYAGGDNKLSPALVQFLVAVQADASITESGGLDFGFSKERKSKRLLSILRRANIRFSHKNSGNRYRFYISKFEPVLELVHRYLQGAKKTFGPWVLELRASTLDLFCNEVFYWDGCFTRMNHYASDSKENADWVQIALSLRGNRARIRSYKKLFGGISWQVDVTHRDYSFTTNVKKSVVSHDGYVYCVSVPSSYILIRMDHNVMVTGQCQNLPRPEHGGIKIKSMFVAGEGNKIVLSDYRQAEVCLAAHLSKDRVWIEALNSGADIHSATAKKCFNLDCPVDMVKKLYDTYRSRAKVVTFGVLYGMSEHGLAPKLGMEKEEARAFIDQYFAGLPDLKAWIEFVHKDAKEKGYVLTVFNRRRRLPDIQLAVPRRHAKPMGVPSCYGDKKKVPPIVRNCYEKEGLEVLLPILGDANKLQHLAVGMDSKAYANCATCHCICQCIYDDERRRRANLVAECERQSVNAMVQGSVADIASVAFARVLEVAVGQGIPIAIAPGERGIRPWSTIHDELGYVVANEYVEPSMRIIEDVMTTVCDLLVPLKVDMVVLDRWSDKHEKH